MNVAIEILEYKIKSTIDSINRAMKENKEWKDSWDNIDVGEYDIIDKSVIDTYKKQLLEYREALKVLTGSDKTSKEQLTMNKTTFKNEYRLARSNCEALPAIKKMLAIRETFNKKDNSIYKAILTKQLPECFTNTIDIKNRTIELYGRKTSIFNY